MVSIMLAGFIYPTTVCLGIASIQKQSHRGHSPMLETSGTDIFCNAVVCKFKRSAVSSLSCAWVSMGLEAAILYRLNMDLSTANLYKKWEEENPPTVMCEREDYATK